MQQSSAVLLVVSLLSGFAAAQGGTVPRGVGSIAQFGIGDRWDAEKSRRVILIDRSQFPWGAGNPGVVNGFRVRRTHSVVAAMQGVQKTIRVRSSATSGNEHGTGTPVGPRASSPQTVFDANHGAAVPQTVFNTTFTYDPQGQLPTFYQGFPMGFSSAITFATPMLVPADADTLVLDIEVAYPTGFDFQPAWWPEEALATPTREYQGSFRRLNAPCPAVTCTDDGNRTAPCMDRCTVSGTHIGATFRTTFSAGEGNLPIFGWIGLIQSVPGTFPGHVCPFLVDPFGCQLLGTSDSFGGLQHTWGSIPNLPFLVDFRLGVQFGAFPTTWNADGAALSGAYELIVGPPPSGQVQYSTVAAACDFTGNLSGVNPCATGNDPFAANAAGAVAATPVLELF